MKHLIFVKKANPQVQTFLTGQGVSWSVQWDADPIWNLLEVNHRIWLLAKADDGTRAVAVPSLSRTMRRVPQKYKDYLTARGVAWQDSDSILDVLVQLTGNENLDV